MATDQVPGILARLRSFVDEQGRLTAYPAKRKMKLYALYYLATKPEKGREYTEREINELLCRWHSFGDPATLRRELYNHRFLYRTADGSVYRLEEHQPTLEDLERLYG